MGSQLLSIGIDSPNVMLMESWMSEGLLPNIKSIKDKGSEGFTQYKKQFRNERCWDIFLKKNHNQSCGANFDEQTYNYELESPLYNPSQPYFYELGDDFKVCLFDLPADLCRNLNGIAVHNWGSELNSSRPFSSPKELIEEILYKYGPHPRSDKEYYNGRSRKSGENIAYSVPSLYDFKSLTDFISRLIRGIEKRTEILLDLISRDDWDLVLAVFNEFHTANHMLWHLGEKHPLSEFHKINGFHAQLEVMKAIDSGIGKVLANFPNYKFLIYTIDNVKGNHMDLPSMLLLPELLYRWNFPGKQTFYSSAIDKRFLPDTICQINKHWKDDIWNQITTDNRNYLSSPSELKVLKSTLNWNPALWYRPMWRKMKAFALPSVADGHIRLNVSGREKYGVVEPTCYHKTINEIMEFLSTCYNPRDECSLVEKFFCIKEDPWKDGCFSPDLVVCFNEDSSPIDVVESKQYGRVGPFPFFRSGGHFSHGTTIHNPFYFSDREILANFKSISNLHLNELGDFIQYLVVNHH